MHCRKNYRDLTDAERNTFVQALYHLKANGIIDQYASEHETHFNHGIHRNSHFLPWHRDFLRRFEIHLRTYDPDIAIPYWDSTVDTNPSDPLWDNAFLGQFDSAWGLDRALGSDTLPTVNQMQSALGNGAYDTFRVDLEGNIHNPPHRWVAGKMAAADSPADPVFYLHHCWIDLLWAQWQLLNPGAPFVSSGAGFDLNDTMMGVTTTPADVINHRLFNLYHYPAGFQEDIPTITLDTPSVNFIEVPEGETRLAAAVFSIEGCDPLHFSIVAGPTLLSGPAATVFGVFSAPVTTDPGADQKGRIWFTYIGTANGDVATGTVTVQCDETGDQFDIMLSANTIARPTAAIVMILDQSNSMNFPSGIGPGIEREDVLKFSAPTAVIALEDEHAMAVCSFDQDAHPGIGITPAAGVGRFTINSAIAGYSPNPNGWTSIGEGVAFGYDIVNPVTNYDVKALVVLTDGHENHGPHTRRFITDVADMINSLNGHVFAIGLGRPEVLRAEALTALCNNNNGYMFTTGDLTPDSTYRLAKYYQQIFAGVTNNEIVRDPEGFIAPGQKYRIPFLLTEADINGKAILLSPAPSVIQFMLETPNGDIIDPAVAASHPMASFEAGSHVSLYRFGLPIPLGSNNAHQGKWHAILKIDAKNYKRYLSSLEQNPALLNTTAAHGIRFNLSVHAYSNLRMRAKLVQNSYEPGATITVRALLTEYGVPVAGRAHCRAITTRPDNTETVLAMTEVEAGVFECNTIAALPGVYRFYIIAEGFTFHARPFTREQILTAAVWRGGDRPPPSSTNDPNKDGRICELIECLLKQKGIRAMLEKSGVNINELRKCLGYFCKKKWPSNTRNFDSVKLEDRLRKIIDDDDVYKTVLGEITHLIK